MNYEYSTTIEETRPKKFLDAGELADELNLTLAFVLREAKEARLPHLRIGNRLRFDLDAVRTALVERMKCEMTERAQEEQA